MKLFIHWPYFLIFLAIAVIFAYIGSMIFKVGFFGSFVITVIALFLVGLLATVEDEMPGGLNNPKSEDEKD